MLQTAKSNEEECRVWVDLCVPERRLISAFRLAVHDTIFISTDYWNNTWLTKLI